MPGPRPEDSAPGPQTSLPGLAPWSDTDAGVVSGPAAAFSTNPPGRAAEQLPTLGYIGRYALKYRIGEGGLGTVYAAHDPVLSRLIAIKTVNVDGPAAQRESFNALFLNEARAAAGLSHPHIVTVFDAGISEHGAYIAMELLKGRDLRQLRQEGWRPSTAQAVLIIRRVADALAYAHSQGVVHRDIKPANIFMVGRTQPRVLDFGIARMAHLSQAQADLAGSDELSLGSPFYMAPEQMRQHPLDRRCDVNSLGVVLYELLTDVRPFSGGTLAEISRAVLEHEPPQAHEVVPAVPKALAEIAARAMAKDPDARYRSATALSRDLKRWLDTVEPEVESDRLVALPAPAPAPRRTSWAALAVAVTIVGLGGWGALSLRQAGPAAPAAPIASAPAMAATAASAAAAAVPSPSATATIFAPSAPSPEAAAASEPAPPVASAVAPQRPASKPRVALQPAPKLKLSVTRAREGRGREPSRSPAQPAAAVAAASGLVQIAVSPWGQVEVDGTVAGTTPPLTQLTLPEGRHTITLRNNDFPAYSVIVNVSGGRPVALKHRFGP